MKWQDFTKDYLNFSRSERIGTLVIVAIMLIVIFLPGMLSESVNSINQNQDTSWISALKKLEIKSPEFEQQDKNYQGENNVNSYVYDRTQNSSSKISSGELFLFDPNTLSTEGWKKLGLKEKLINTLQNYLDKGGHFYKKEDLQKIYGLRKDDYEKLATYIRIETKNETKNFETYSSKPSESAKITSINLSRYSAININTSDTSVFISLPGIGSKLAARIVTFRDKLGGFYLIDQVGETYGLPDSTFQKIKQYLKLENPSIKKININTATLEELKAHPYIKYNIASPIVAYRNEHGSFKSIEEIKNVMVVTEELFKKIAPYLTTQ